MAISLKSIPRWVKITAAAAVLVFLFFFLKSCRKTEYWHGQYDAAQKKVEDLGYTIKDLQTGLSAAEAKTKAQVAELQEEIANRDKVIEGYHGEIDSTNTVIAGLEEKIEDAKTVEEENKLLHEVVAVMKTKDLLRETEIGEYRKTIVSLNQVIEVKDRAYATLKLDYDKAIGGWQAEKDGNQASKDFIRALQKENGLLRFQATAGKLGLAGLAVAAAIFLLSK
jgi:peptidoglycan hydrolase CwlO-like protein